MNTSAYTNSKPLQSHRTTMRDNFWKKEVPENDQVKFTMIRQKMCKEGIKNDELMFMDTIRRRVEQRYGRLKKQIDQQYAQRYDVFQTQKASQPDLQSTTPWVFTDKTLSSKERTKRASLHERIKLNKILTTSPTGHTIGLKLKHYEDDRKPCMPQSNSFQNKLDKYRLQSGKIKLQSAYNSRVVSHT